jgi:hypothetical protein
LIGLAVRIAHGLGVHSDGDGSSFGVFEAEMRRRLWWQIITLDQRASMDRGSEPLLAEDSYNTARPCNLNDEDFTHSSQLPLPEKTGPTEMTISLLSMDALSTGRKINFSASSVMHANMPFQAREDLVKQYARRVESMYLAGCDYTSPSTKLLYMLGQYWIHKLWLVLYYPLQHRMSPQQTHSKPLGLQTALTFLKLHDLIEQDPSSAGFAWLLTTYVPWHAVAVMLAELATQPNGPLADRAWTIIQTRFKDWSARVADVKEAMLWDLIKVLLKRARAARDSRQLSEVERALQESDITTSLPDLSSSPFLQSRYSTDTGNDDIFGQSYKQFEFVDPILEPSFDFMDLASSETVQENLGAADMMSNDFTDWNNFTLDVNALRETGANLWGT